MDSSVWEARQLSVERRVAIKILPQVDPESIRRFARGAHVASNLNHPNVNTVHDYGETDDGHLYLVLEHLVGAMLTRFLRRGPLPLERSLKLTLQLLKALDHVHGCGFVHRDVKPDNLFITKVNDDAFFLKLVDFGIARHIDSGSPNDYDPFKVKVTQQHQICGTPEYMAPEQIIGGALDARADLYSVGVTLFRCLTGQLPFEDENRYDLYQAKLQEAPKRLKDALPSGEFPDALEQVVAMALSRTPERRFQTAQQMAYAIERLLETIAANQLHQRSLLNLGQATDQQIDVIAPQSTLVQRSGAPTDDAQSNLNTEESVALSATETIVGSAEAVIVPPAARVVAPAADAAGPLPAEPEPTMAAPLASAAPTTTQPTGVSTPVFLVTLVAFAAMLLLWLLDVGS